MALSLFNANVRNGTNSAASAVLLHTATNTSCLLVWTNTNEATSLSAVHIGATQFTRLHAVSAGTSRYELWGLTAANTGINTISVEAVGGNLMRMALVATSWIGQQQGTSPFGGVNGGTGGAVNNLALSLSATATDLVVFAFGISANAAVTLTNAGVTTHATATATTGGRLVVGSLIPSSGTASVSATAGATNQMGAIGIHLLAKPDLIETLADNFSTDTIGTNWTKFSSTAGGVAVITVSSSAVVITPDGGPTPLGFPEPAWGVNSTKVYTFSGSRVYARIDPAFVNQAVDGGSLRTDFGVINADPIGYDQPNDEGIGFEIVGPTTNQRIHCLVWGDVADTAQVTANAATVSYIAANHAWFQLRNDGTSIFWEVAPNVSGGPGTFSTIASMTVASISTFDNVNLWLHRARIRFWVKVVNDSYSNTFLTTPAKMFAVNTADSALAVVTLSMSATEGFSDTFASTAQVRVTGRLSATDAADIFSSSAQVRVTARLSATDAPDVFSSSAKVRIVAAMAATDAPDTFSSSANVRIAARLSATEAFSDTLAASANVRVTAAMAATDTPDTFQSTAQVRIQAAMSATDAPDIFAASATVLDETIRFARLSATDAPDTFVASAYVVVTARMSATDAPDIFLATTPAAPRADTPSSAGHGDKRNDDYQPANDAFWEARERYLLSLRPEILEEPSPEISPSKIGTVEPAPVPRLLVELRFERRDALTAIEHARNMRQLRAAGKRLRAINRRILEQKLAAAKREVETIKSIIDEPRRREVARLRKQLSLLQMAHSLLKLQDHL